MTTSPSQQHRRSVLNWARSSETSSERRRRRCCSYQHRRRVESMRISHLLPMQRIPSGSGRNQRRPRLEPNSGTDRGFLIAGTLLFRRMFRRCEFFVSPVKRFGILEDINLQWESSGVDPRMIFDPFRFAPGWIGRGARNQKLTESG